MFILPSLDGTSSERLNVGCTVWHGPGRGLRPRFSVAAAGYAYVTPTQLSGQGRTRGGGASLLGT